VAPRLFIRNKIFLSFQNFNNSEVVKNFLKLKQCPKQWTISYNFYSSGVIS
jgi:hypothetical protein